MTPAEYVAHGWALVPIPAGKKGPVGKGWNEREQCVVPPTWQGNVGLAHAYSGTCAIDIDDVEKAAEWLSVHGIDLSELLAQPDAVMISSGRPNRAKLLYRITGEPLPSRKICEGKANIIDFRCSNARGTTVQDVLPPSIHPDTGKPYEWAYGNELVGHWSALPAIPEALLNVWRSLIVDSHDNSAESSQFENSECDLAALRDLLLQHDPDVDRDTWVKNMAAVHHETRGSAEGLELVVDWSSRGTKYKGRSDVERVWRSFHDSGDRLITAASLRVDTPASDDDFDVITVEESKAVVAAVPGQLPKLNFDTDEDGWIYASKDNMRLALSRGDWCGTRIVLDTFRDDIMLGSGEGLRPLKDTDYERLGIWLEFNGFKTVAHENLRRSVALVADDNQIDSAQIWLESLKWDGVSRVERFLTDYFSAGDSPYIRAVSLYWWTAHAGRVMDPGCKADMVPILVGEQGVGKSTGVAAIAPAPENFVEVRLDQEDEEIARRIRGCLVAEIGELRGLQSREAESIKGMITTTHDKWTPKYVERSHTVARRLVFIGTTNSDEFLADETGNRRWLPVRVGKVRVAAIGADRDQLWAEALVLWTAAGVAFSAAETLARGVHDAHMVHDVWQENVERWIEGGGTDEWGETIPSKRGTPFAMSDLLTGALGLELKNVGMAQERRVGKILRLLGFEKRVVRTDGVARKLWVTRSYPSEC